jgi:hypothetical protein
VTLALENKEPSVFVKGFLLLVSFISAQRFLFSPIDSVVCIFPIFLVFFYFNNIKLRNSLILFSLFISVDNAPEILSTSFSFLRYSIYIFAVYFLYKGNFYNLKNVYIFFTFLLFFGIITVFNFHNLHLNTLFRDLLVVVLAFPILCSRNSSNFEINLSLLNLLIVFYILSELINVFFLSRLGYFSDDYLSYISTKSFIVLPSFYFLIKRKYFIAIPVILATIIVLIAYTTRMIILTYFIGLFIYFLVNGLFKIRFLILILFIFLSGLFLSNKLNFEFQGYKATGVFIQLVEDLSLEEKFLLLDPVRYYETKMFFDRNIFEILFGSGFGSGLIDTKNDLSFVKVTDTAFSEKELNEGIFYNLHDTWIDLGLRFGLLTILLVYFFSFKFMFSVKSFDIKITGFVLLILFSCATYSTQGLILLAYLFFYAKSNFYNF